MPYFLIKYLHQHLSGNLRDIILIKNEPLWETIPDLVTLLWGKWLINGTIATNVTEFTTRVLLRLGSDLKYVMHCQWNDLYHWISVLGLKSFNTQLLKFAAITYWHQSVSLPCLDVVALLYLSIPRYICTWENHRRKSQFFGIVYQATLDIVLVFIVILTSSLQSMLTIVLYNSSR